MDEIRCPYCNKNNVVKKGLSKLKKSSRQRYLCKDCSHKFSLTAGKKRFDPKVIIETVCLYNQGYSYEEACESISRKHKVNISRASACRWAKEYDLGYSGIRAMITRRNKHPIVMGRIFKHFGLAYNFKYHKGKLNLSGFNDLKRFILNLSNGIDEKYFTAESKRCSDIKEDVSADIKVFDNTKMGKAIGSMLKDLRNNGQRHSIVENLMLNCDRDTVAIEVPVWHWDKGNNIGVCGHIDILQVKFGKVWILDYKPDAEKEDIDKVVSQLYSYATGLRFRAEIRLEDMTCCWFDESKMYVFEAGNVRLQR